MNVLSLSVWIVIQAITLVVSSWFVIFGIRNWAANKAFSMIVILVAFIGFYNIIESISVLGLI